MAYSKNNTDRFPLWGPYSKKYSGISHIVNSCTRPGVRFDLSTVPALANMDIHLPNVTLPTGWHPWTSTPDYRQYSYRVDLEWKDVVYGDVSYTRMDDHSILVRTELVNNTDIMQNLMINYFSAIEYPQKVYCDPVLPEKCAFINALDYKDMGYHTPRPWDENCSDGLKKGEVADGHFTDGCGLGDRSGKWHLPTVRYPLFGGEKGDHVSYELELTEDYSDAVLTLRYRSIAIKYHEGVTMDHSVTYPVSEDTAEFLLNGETKITLPPTYDLKLVRIPLGPLTKGTLDLELVSEGTGAVELDFLAVSEASDEVTVALSEPKVVPAISEQETADGSLVSLSYEDTDETYFLRTFNENTRFRRINTGSLEDGMISRLSNPDVTFDDVLEPFTASFERKHSDLGFFHNTLVHTLFVEPHDRHIEYAVLSDEPIDYLDAAAYEAIYQYNRPETEAYTEAGKDYTFSAQLLQAAVMTNVVFPIRKDQNYIIHHTPGKRWDSLYTWDSGFIGLGMNAYAPDFADFILDNYLSYRGNKDYAFLHHGSPVPVQIYQYLEMLQTSHDKTHLLSWYDRLKFYYEFLIGKVNGSTTARYKSGITSTYDYFYSTSGMDDYPAQAHMISDFLQRHAAPVLSASQAIRFAKILTMVADHLELPEDVTAYQADIDRLTDALQRYSWDEEAGYFSYVLHNDSGEPVGIYRTKDGENLDKGLDGIYPLIAGACTQDQIQRIMGHLTSPKEMLSPYGISAVDQSAGYFMVNGYWNGNVWFPHQWFIWKVMLDLGETDFAYTIAKLALDVWKREVDATHYTFEMVNVVTGRGGWFHNFGGLSTPIGMWGRAYYKAGTINVGMDTWIEDHSWNEDQTELTMTYKNYVDRPNAKALIVMKDLAEGWKVLIDDTPVSANERFPGMLEVPIGSSDRVLHTLKITR